MTALAQTLDFDFTQPSILAARAVADKTTVFLCDVVYAGIIEVQNIPAEALEPTIFIQGAQLLYPFARRVVADLTRDGGFPPLQLDPMDFVALYQQQRNQAAPAATA